jgi:hypothetical protein
MRHKQVSRRFGDLPGRYLGGEPPQAAADGAGPDSPLLFQEWDEMGPRQVGGDVPGDFAGQEGVNEEQYRR